jgi:hypothetical protein
MRESYLAEIRRLDPVRDHVRIVHLDACYEFPFDTTRALELAFSRTFAVPSSPSCSRRRASSPTARSSATTHRPPDQHVRRERLRLGRRAGGDPPHVSMRY